MERPSAIREGRCITNYEVFDTDNRQAPVKTMRKYWYITYFRSKTKLFHEQLAIKYLTFPSSTARCTISLTTRLGGLPRYSTAWIGLVSYSTAHGMPAAIYKGLISSNICVGGRQPSCTCRLTWDVIGGAEHAAQWQTPIGSLDISFLELGLALRALGSPLKPS